ncbi:hypothetical protein FALBO_12640 [Fusarium albosuccineum]|uniref:Uncharacterized protein n=1 Tax=Fusarium albosuccineum TaxID=1237068 RepID=A0A8H4L3L0_9HYPO|nr:hypothetical protein FALBO_12640 [Fusarium albosuccineum]
MPRAKKKNKTPRKQSQPPNWEHRLPGVQTSPAAPAESPFPAASEYRLPGIQTSPAAPAVPPFSAASEHRLPSVQTSPTAPAEPPLSAVSAASSSDSWLISPPKLRLQSSKAKQPPTQSSANGDPSNGPAKPLSSVQTTDEDDPFVTPARPQHSGQALDCDSDDPFLSPEEVQPSQPRPQQESRGQGPTGFHDVNLDHARGVFREPSLRRSSGIEPETPVIMRKDIAKRKEEGRWMDEPGQPTQTAEPPRSHVPSSSSQQTGSHNPFLVPRPKMQRGDVPPLIHRSVAKVKKGYSPGASPKKNTAAPKDKERHPQENSTVEVFNVPTANGHNQAPLPLVPRDSKFRIFEICLELQDVFLETPHEPLDSDEVFWETVCTRLGRDDICFPGGWRELKACVERWCGSRRPGLRRGNVPPTAGPHDRHAELTDEWNRVWAKRFCRYHQGYLESAGWALKEAPEKDLQALTEDTQNSLLSASAESIVETVWSSVKEEVLSFVESKLQDWAKDMLEKRVNELETLTRAPLFNCQTAPETYERFVKYLLDRHKAWGNNSGQVREIEAVMSLVMELEPGLERRIRKALKTTGITQSDENYDTDKDNSEGTSEQSSDDKDDQSALPLGEPKTPVTNPPIKRQRRNCQQKAQQAAKEEEERDRQALDILLAGDIEKSRKRKASASADEGSTATSSPAIQKKKKKSCRDPDATAMTPQHMHSEGRRAHRTQPASRQALPLVSSEFSAVDQARGSRQQPESPSLFVTPAHPRSNSSQRRARKWSSSRDGTNRGQGQHRDESSRFARESTTEFQAMTPNTQNLSLRRRMQILEDKMNESA